MINDLLQNDKIIFKKINILKWVMINLKLNI